MKLKKSELDAARKIFGLGASDKKHPTEQQESSRSGFDLILDSVKARCKAANKAVEAQFIQEKEPEPDTRSDKSKRLTELLASCAEHDSGWRNSNAGSIAEIVSILLGEKVDPGEAEDEPEVDLKSWEMIKQDSAFYIRAACNTFFNFVYRPTN